MKPTLASVVTFTFRDDSDCAVQCARSVGRLGLPHYLIEDAAAPLSLTARGGIAAVGGRIETSHHPRGGNLNGLANLEAQLTAFSAVAAATGSLWVVKLDSDTIIQNLTWLDGAEGAAAVCFRQRKWWFQGPCYALSVSALGLMRQAILERPHLLSPLAPQYPEDVATGWLACAVAGPERVRAVAGYPDGPGIAHWHFKGGAEADLCRPFSALSFGNRHLLPDQMPPALKRLESARAMEAYLTGVPFSGV